MVDGYLMVKLDVYVKGLPSYISAMVKVKIGIAVVRFCGQILRFNHFYHEKFGFWLWMFETMGFSNFDHGQVLFFDHMTLTPDVGPMVEKSWSPFPPIPPSFTAH